MENQVDSDCKLTHEEIRQEYNEVNSFLRHYSLLRFVMLSVFFAVTAAVASAAFGVVEVRTYNPNLIMFFFKIIGFLITIAFLFYEIRLEKLIRHYQLCGRLLEEKLHFSLMKTRPQSNLIFWTTRGLYFAFIVFWLTSILITPIFGQ